MMSSFKGNLLTQGHEILSLETRDSTLSYGENPESLSRLGLVWYQVVTHRWTTLRRKTKIGVTVLRGRGSWCANYGFKMSSKVNLTGRQKPPEKHASLMVHVCLWPSDWPLPYSLTGARSGRVYFTVGVYAGWPHVLWPQGVATSVFVFYIVICFLFLPLRGRHF